MAGLSSPGGRGPGSDPGPDRDRGQIILVTAFALAVAFVALSVVINGAIFTQNLATRGDTAGGGDALQQRQQAEQMVGDLLEHENEDSSPDDQDLEEAIRELSNASSYQQSVAGRAVDYVYQDSSDGTRIYQSATSGFVNDSISSVPDTRKFEIDVTDVTETVEPASSPFTVIVDDGSSVWKMKIGSDPSSSELNVTTINGSGARASCTARQPSSSDPVEINVTSGLLAGQPCSALDFGEGTNSPYSFAFRNVSEGGTNTIEGEYSVIVNKPSAGLGTDPTDPVLYSATVEYTYRTANLVYETDIRVAPGEPDD